MRVRDLVAERGVGRPTGGRGLRVSVLLKKLDMRGLRELTDVFDLTIGVTTG